MLESYIIRPPTAQDVDAVYDLMIRCDIRDVGFADTEKKDIIYDWGSINLARDAWLALDAQDKLYGYAACLPWKEGVRFVIYNDPGTENTDLYPGLLALCESRAADIIHELNDPKKRGIFTHISDSSFYKRKWQEEAGYSIKKFIFNMHRDLTGILPEPNLPEGYSIRTAVTGQDDRTIHALVQEAFDWRERQTQSFEDWKGFIMRPDIYKENLWFLAVKDGEVIGVCLCFQFSEIGWIRQLAVKNPYRKLGIGRALLQRAFQVFQVLGMEKAGLAVESFNPNAIHFYQTAGMVKAVQLDEYVKEI
jgi:ribosomal protein S18 acetylase RimI-like enzyme